VKKADKIKIEKIIENLHQIKVQILQTENFLKELIKEKEKNIIESPQLIVQSKNEWNKLRTEISDAENPMDKVMKFLDKKTKKEIKKWLTINHLPIDPKYSKEKIAKEIIKITRSLSIIKSGP